MTVSAPEGCILNAPKPAAVCIRHVIGQMLPDVVFGCLAQAIPERVPAEGTSCLWNIIVRGSVRGGQGGNYGFSMAITSNGGTGARPHADGLSATAYPSRRERHARGDCRGHYAADLLEEGAAAWIRRCRAHRAAVSGRIIEIESGIGEPFELLAAFDRIDHPPRGRNGGAPGAPGMVTIKDGAKLRGKGTQLVRPGQRLVVKTPGGGGLGEAGNRDPVLAEQDRREGRAGQ